MYYSRSGSDKNLARSGKSEIIQKLAIEARTVNEPSRMKIHDHPAFPPIPSMFAMAAASNPPKDGDRLDRCDKRDIHTKSSSNSSR